MDEEMERARQRGEAAVSLFAKAADANELQRESIAKFERLVRHGGTVDLIVRRDAVDHRIQADWLKPVFRNAGGGEETPIMHQAVEAECVHLCLDKAGVPRSDVGGVLSLWGRVCRFRADANSAPSD